MAVTVEDVRHVAELARLGLDETELAELTSQLNGILQHVDALKELDTDAADVHVESPLEAVRLRSDEPGADALAVGPAELAPEWGAWHFLVPRLASHDAAGADDDAGADDAP